MKVKLLGITGGAASGKTTIADLLINEFVTSSEVKSFFLIPFTILVKVNSDMFDILF